MEPTNNEVSIPPLERKKKKNLNSRGQLILVGIFFFLCACLGFWMAQAAMDPLIPPEKAEEGNKPAYSSEDVLNILLLGIDQRENEPARADTIILASLHLEDKEIRLLSIPRDTRMKLADKGTVTKVNHAHAFGGVELTVKTVEQFLDIPVHYYVETNFQGFSKIIDALGGITLNVEQRMYKPEENIDLQAGLQKLNGYDALAYVRWRDDGRADIGRIERQQKFFKAVMDQALQFSTIWKIPELLEEVNQQVKTDLNLQKMLAIANKFKDLKNVKMETATVPGTPDTIDGVSYWVADQKGLTKILEQIYDEGAATTASKEM